VKGFNNKVMK